MKDRMSTEDLKESFPEKKEPLRPRVSGAQ
jgi:hypothetical protein